METTHKSLLRCTIKKSADVVKKLVKCVAYAAIGLITCVLAIYGAIGIWAIAADPAYICITAMVSFLLSIPWYYYAGAVVIAAIPVYSFLWCVARELTEEDWKSDEAEVIALALALALLALALVTFTFTFTFALLALDLPNSKIFLVPGAYLHYRKRVKAE